VLLSLSSILGYRKLKNEIKHESQRIDEFECTHEMAVERLQSLKAKVDDISNQVDVVNGIKKLKEFEPNVF